MNYTIALAAQESVEQAFAVTRAGIEFALSDHEGVSPGDNPTGAVVEGDVQPHVGAPPPPPGVRASVWAIVLVRPREGDLTVEAMRDALGLSTSALNTRLVIAKGKGWVESAGWGRCRLTDAGRVLQGQRLKIVSST